MGANVDAALRASGTTARRTTTYRLILPTLSLHPSSFQMLVSSSGHITPAGELYFQLTGQHNPQNARFDPNEQLTRREDTEYIRDRSGHITALRTLQPEGDWRYTRAGHQYFAQSRGEYLVQVPVIIRGVRSNGARYERRDSLWSG